MARIRTHYDNLKVMRDAPPEVIRAAYRSLSQKYHPDRQPGNEDAARIMRILNVAYETLSDPVQRAKHDAWIAEQEELIAASDAESNTPREPPQRPSAEQQASRTRSFTIDEDALKRGASHAPRGIATMSKGVAWFAAIFIILVVIGSFSDGKDVSSQSSIDSAKQTQPAQPDQPIKTPTHETAPNGLPWPSNASYLPLYPLLATDGYSAVTIDNSRNNSNVFVKLVSLNEEPPRPVRQFFVPAHGKFMLENITAGRYDIRYRDLKTGNLSRTEPFDLQETRDSYGTRYTNLEITIYKVQNGNMSTYGLPERDF